MKIVKFIICLLFGIMFLNAGLNKLFHYLPDPSPADMPGEAFEAFQAAAKIKWLMPLVGIIEAIGGLLVIIPKTRLFAAIMILPVMIGIVLHNAAYMPQGLGIALPLLLINIWILLDGRKKIAHLFE